MALSVFSPQAKTQIRLLAIVETLILVASVYGAAWLRFPGEGLTQGPWHFLLIALLFGVTIQISMLAMGLYQYRQRFELSGTIARLALSFFFGAFLLAFVYYALPDVFLGRGVFMIAAAIALPFLFLVRKTFLNAVDRDAFKRNVLVLGAGERAAPLTQLRRRADRRGFRILGFVPIDGEKVLVDPSQLMRLDTRLLQFSRLHNVDEIVVAMDDRRKGFPIADLLECRFAGIHVAEIASFMERETGRVKISILNPSWIIFSDGFRRNDFVVVMKRVFDIGLAVALSLLTLPVMAATALAILIEGKFREPVIYRQTRVGLHGKHFLVLKFRSMRTDAEADGRPRWATADDSRVTRVGAFIRKYRLDELPQLINVLRGDMSFVGPRPERPEFVEELATAIPYYHERHSVKPGITGWAQLSYPYGSSQADALEKLQYDLYYIKNQSLMFDLYIILQTIEVVVFGKGAR